MSKLEAVSAGRRRLAVASVALVFASSSAAVARADWTSAPVVPKLSGATKQTVIAIMRQGRRLGNRPNVFAKVGDSISEAPAFLQGLGCGRWKLGSHTELRSTIRYFAARSLSGSSTDCRPVNSFSRNSAATLRTVASDWPLQPGASPDPACRPDETPLLCELRLDRPAYVVAMLGTNDVTIAVSFGGSPLSNYLLHMGELIDTALRLGSVPVVSTIPPRPDDAAKEAATEELNAGLYALAAERHVPVINLWRAFVPLPNRGLSADSLHPSLYRGPGCTGICYPSTCAPVCNAADFTRQGVKFGYDMRNLITLQMLRRLVRLQPGGPGKRGGR